MNNIENTCVHLQMNLVSLSVVGRQHHQCFFLLMTFLSHHHLCIYMSLSTWISPELLSAKGLFPLLISFITNPMHPLNSDKSERSYRVQKKLWQIRNFVIVTHDNQFNCIYLAWERSMRQVAKPNEYGANMVLGAIYWALCWNPLLRVLVSIYFWKNKCEANNFAKK